jgi:hypothetical protein
VGREERKVELRNSERCTPTHTYTQYLGDRDIICGVICIIIYSVRITEVGEGEGGLRADA